MSERLRQLVSEIEKHNYHYWILNEPLISDIEYDNLLRELQLIEPNHPLLSKRYFITDNGKIRHYEPILSVKKFYDKDELISYLSKIVRNDNEQIQVSPKFDGLFGVLYDGKVLATSGDGEYGDDISDKIDNLNIITNHSPFPKILKGELIFSNSYFYNNIQKHFKTKNNQEYKTPRNAVAGIINLKGKINSHIKIDFIDHNYYQYIVSFRELVEYISELDNIYKELDYNLDGIIIKIADNNYFTTLGSTSSYYKGCIAYKFSNETKSTKIISVSWNVGINNIITPTAILEPININNVTISKVALHNAKYILDNNIGINTIVHIERTSDAVPTIIKIENNDNIEPIVLERCPDCNSEIDYIEPNLVCLNSNCIGMLSKKISNGLKRLNINNCGDLVVLKILKNYNDIKTIDQIFDLSEDDFKDLSLHYVYKELQIIKAKPIYDYEILSALCIEGFGKEICKQLCQHVDIRKLFNEFHNLDYISNFGTERTNKLYENIEQNKKVLNRLLEIFTNIKTISTQVSDKKTICFSGDFTKPKKYYYEIAEQKGYQVVETVTKSLDLLVIPYSDFFSNKVEKAINYNIPIMTIKEFLQ